MFLPINIRLHKITNPKTLIKKQTKNAEIKITISPPHPKDPKPPQQQALTFDPDACDGLPVTRCILGDAGVCSFVRLGRFLHHEHPPPPPRPPHTHNLKCEYVVVVVVMIIYFCFHYLCCCFFVYFDTWYLFTGFTLF